MRHEIPPSIQALISQDKNLQAINALRGLYDLPLTHAMKLIERWRCENSDQFGKKSAPIGIAERGKRLAERVEAQTSLLRQAHDLLRELTAIIPRDGVPYAKATELMAHIRADIGNCE